MKKTVIKFGTDGFRGIIAKDFTFETVERIINAINLYLRSLNSKKNTVIIGYDPRFMARDFAQFSAELLKNYGFKVVLSKKVVPTPIVAYCAKYFPDSIGAIMFTASHNPKEYQGIKFIPDYAGPATSDITDEIVANLEAEFEPKIKGSVKEVDFAPKYFEHIKSLINFDKIRELNKNIIFDGLYSATIGYFDKILSNEDIKFDAINMRHDPQFGGGMPEPKPQYMQDLIEMVKKTPNAVGFANDGDGDRFGVINENGEYVTPNEIIAILLLHLKKHKNMEGSLVKTVGASLMLDKIAEKCGVEVIETAVGFKHVGDAMRKFNPIIGGEESGGLSIRGHIPEKDGILANLLVLEAMAYENKTLIELQEEIQQLAGCKFYNDRVDLKLETREEIEKVLDKFKITDEFAGMKVLRKDFKDGVKLYLDDNASWVLVRPSGTEPLLRIYFESDSLDKIEKFKK